MKKICLVIIIALILLLIPSGALASDYELYFARFESIETLEDAEKTGYEISPGTYITDSFEAAGISECTVYPAINKQFGRAALFFADENGLVLYKTEDLECNNFLKGSLYQLNVAVAATAVRDLNGDGLQDIILVSRCFDGGNKFKIGDVLFQSSGMFYRDWRISDKINRFSMNKAIDMITAFVRDGQSTEFLYKAETFDELTDNGYIPLVYQSFEASFEKFGEVRVVSGTYQIGLHHVFILYLANSDGQIVWNFQSMRDYDNFSNMTGISFKDVDGDGWSDLSVLAKYYSLDDDNKVYGATDFSIYYQRNGYFFEDKDFHASFTHKITGSETMDDIVLAAREYWGWHVE